MKDLYRKAALERLASPDQLDKAPKITSPLSWLVLLALTVVVAITLVWSILGTIPETISANGIVVNAGTGTNTIYSSVSGRVTAVLADRGKLVYENSPVMIITPAQGEPVTIKAGLLGYVTDVVVKQGEDAKTNGDLMRVAPMTETEQIVVCYVSTSIVGKVEIGMDVHVTLDSADSQTYGHMVGRVVNIDRYAASSAGMESVLGSNNNIASRFTSNESSAVPVSAVTVELYPADPEIPTLSGYWWSNEKGREQQIENGDMCSARIIIKRIAPIEKLFTKIKEVWGSQ